MHAADVFQDDSLIEAAEAASLGVCEALNGLPVPVGLAAMFSAFVSVARAAGRYAGLEWDTLMALLLKRQAPTHAGPGRIQ